MAKRIFLFVLTNILVMITLQIVSSVVLALLGAGGLIGSPAYQVLMVWAMVWGFGGALISLAMSRMMAKWFMGVQVIDPDTVNPSERQLLMAVYGLAQRAGMRVMPEVGFYESPELNAFATGPSRDRALVAVSTGLLTHMDTSQLEGVLGHEISHVVNGDMVTMTLIQGVVNSFVIFFSRLLASVVGSQVEERNRYLVEMLTSIVLQIAFGLLGSLVVNFFSQRREFRADQGGAKLAGKSAMISALKGLAFNSGVEPQLDEAQSGFAALKISSNDVSWFGKLLSSHPPLEERIRRLESLPS